MKSRVLTIGLLLLVTMFPVMGKTEKGAVDSQTTQQSTAAEPTVTVSLCVLAGNVSVQAWDRNEVMARSSEGARIELKREGGEGSPASKVQILVIDKDDILRTRRGCQASSDIAVQVPRGATVHIQTREGDIEIAGVATAYAGTQSGDINIDRVSRVIEVGTLGGGVTITESVGRMDVNSIGGTVVITNVKPVDPDDLLEVSSVSGDIELQGVTHAVMNLRTLNGNLRMTGPLAKGGRYGISTMSGDVTLALPPDASFQLHARMSSSSDIVTDFPLTIVSEAMTPGVPLVGAPPMPPSNVTAPAVNVVTPAVNVNPPNVDQLDVPNPTPPQTPEPATPPAPAVVVNKVVPKIKIKPDKLIIAGPTLRRLSAICGSGDAVISLASFSGTLHLQKN